MKRKLCCILMLIVLLLNSSLMIIVSEAVDAVQTAIETNAENAEQEKVEKIKTLAEIGLTKYENFDTTTENSEGGSKGVLVQFNLKTGIEFSEGVEYKALKKTSTNIDLPWIGDYKPERVEVVTKSTQATNGGKSANYEYHSSTGILSIATENSNYTENVPEARDEYEIICIYNSECYINNEERDLRVRANIEENLNDEEETRVATQFDETYKVTENIGESISVEHDTEDVYNGYITANTLNSSNKYETTYNETSKIMVSNKDIAQKIEIREGSETSLYIETSIDKNQVLDMIGDNGSIDIVDEAGKILKTVNKDTETDDNGKIKVIYENRTQNLIIVLNNIQKEGIIEIQNARVIEPTAVINDNIVPTQISIKGINTVSEEIKNENGETETQTTEVVKYEKQNEHNVELKQAVSNVDAKLDVESLVNNVVNNVLLTVTLRTDAPSYSLFRNPIIAIELPKEVEEVGIGTPELMYNNKIFKITSAFVNKNGRGNKVINLQLEGEQTSYEESSVIEGTNIEIPLTIQLNNQLRDKVGLFRIAYKNEMTNTIEYKEMEVTLLNKLVSVVPPVFAQIGDEITGATEGEVTNVYEADGVKVEIIQKVGDTIVPENGTLYEQQIVKQVVRVTNTSTTAKSVNIKANMPEEMDVVKLYQTIYEYDEEYNYYKKFAGYGYISSGKTTEIKIENLNAGDIYETYFESKVLDLAEGQDNVQSTVNYDITIGTNAIKQISMQNIIKQAQVTVFTKCFDGNEKKDWDFKIDVTNLTDKELRNVNISFEASSIFDIDIAFSTLDSETPIGTFDGNVWTYTIDSIAANSVLSFGVSGLVNNVAENEANTYELNSVTTVYGEGIETYKSNESRVAGDIEAVEVKMTSDKEGQELKYDEEITYTVTIKNTGRNRKTSDIFTLINVQDVIPREFAPISATYNYFVIEYKTIENTEGIQMINQIYTEETNTLDLSNVIIPEGYDEEDAPNINMDLTIPEGKTVTIVIKAKVKMLYENKEVTNTLVAKGEGINTKTASLTNKLLKYDYDEGPKEVNVTSVTLNANTMELEIGKSRQLTATVNPENATNKNIYWKSSNSEIATVDENGKVTGIKAGTVPIIVTTEEGPFIDICMVTVKESSQEPTDPNKVSVTGISLNTSNMNLKVSESQTLIATITPENATNKKVYWTSSDSSIAKVDNNGNVTGLRGGVATIVATTEDGGKVASCKVTVTGSSTPNPEPDPNPEPGSEKISISGTAWIDENEDGKRTTNEQILSNLPVALYDYKNSKFIRENGEIKEVTTDANGKYQFDNLDKSQYIVIFLYDTNTYTLTEYQKAGIIESKNSDAIMKTANINGQKIVAGLTDVLTAEGSLTNIDIGLIKNKNFDLEIQKYVSKITVQTSKGTKSYTYDNKQFAKVEIHSKEINGATVIIEYKMVVTNKGEVAGKAAQIIDTIPIGLKFYSELNKDWYENNGKLYTTSLSNQTIGVGESKEVTLILTKELNNNNVGQITNTASIGISSNDRATEDMNIENNISKADVLVAVSTGLAKWIGITSAIIGTLVISAILIIKNKKLLKITSFIFVFGMICFSAGDAFAITGKYLPEKLTFYDWDTQEFKGYDEYGNELWGTKTYVTINGKRVFATCDNHGLGWLGLDGSTTHTGTLQKETITETPVGQWKPTLSIELTDQTQKGSVKFTKIDNSYNKIGPFRINWNNDNRINITSNSIKVDYINSAGTTIKGASFEVLDFGLGKDFYIKIPTNVRKVLNVSVAVKGKYGQTRDYTITVSGRYTFPGQLSSYYDAIQPMCTDEITLTQTKTQNAENEASINIAGPWIITGDLEVKKVDAELKDARTLSDVEFRMCIGSNTHARNVYLAFYKPDNTFEPKITADTIVFDNNAMDNWKSGTEVYATAGGIRYKVKINANYDVIKDANGNTVDNKVGTRFKTNAQGKVTFKNLQLGSYGFYEVVNNHYGYTRPAVVSITMDKPLATTEWKVENEKQTTNFHIKKVDEKAPNTVLPNVEFILTADWPTVDWLPLVDKDANGKIITTYKYVVVKGTGDNVTNYTSSNGDLNGWVKSAKGKILISDIAYTNDKNLATRFITNNNGQLSVCNLLAKNWLSDCHIFNGNKIKTSVLDMYANANKYIYQIDYYIEEVANPNVGYDITLEKNYGVTWDANSAGGKVTLTRLPVAKAENINNTEGLSITVKNKKAPYGNLEVIKVDEELNTRVLPGVEFKLCRGKTATSSTYLAIYTSAGTFVPKITADAINFNAKEMAAYKDSSSVVHATIGGTTYTVKFNVTSGNATSFVTNSQGRVKFNNLQLGDYGFYEVRNNNYGYTKPVFSTVTISDAMVTKAWKIGNQKQTGNLHITKVDDIDTNKVLPNVEFVLKSTWPAEPGIEDYYIIVKGTGNNVVNYTTSDADLNGWIRTAQGKIVVSDIAYTKDRNLATRFITDANGKLSVYDLITKNWQTTFKIVANKKITVQEKNMSSNDQSCVYQIEEVANPNYGYLVGDSINNLGVNYGITWDEKAPSGQVIIDRLPVGKTEDINNKEGTSTVIKNHQAYIGIEGIVWEDKSETKDNAINNIYDNIEPLVEGIKVYLYKKNAVTDATGKLVMTEITDADGKYHFESIGTEYILADELDKYYIEFEYDGLKFTSVAPNTNCLATDYDINSKADEVPSGRTDGKDRENINEDFSEITNNTARNSNGDKTYDLNYDFANHVSRFKNYWNYQYNADNTRLKVTYDYNNEDYYEIIASTAQSGFNIKSAYDNRKYNSDRTAVTGINLGIVEREQPNLRIKTDLQTVNVVVNGYDNEYTYALRQGVTQDDNYDMDIRYSKDDGSYDNRKFKKYQRPLYESDLALADKDPNLMQIFVTYKIQVVNISNSLTMKTNEIVNYHDSRYIIKDSWIGNDVNNKAEWKTDEKYGDTHSDVPAEKISKVYTTSLANTEVISAKEARDNGTSNAIDVYIRYQLKDTGVKDLLRQRATLTDVFEITSYSTGLKTNGTWTNYAGIDENSNPGSADIQFTENNGTTEVKINGSTETYTYNTEEKIIENETWEDDTDQAPSLILGLDELIPTRGISGVVFEDGTEDATRPNEERLGDGKFDANTENRVKNVEIKLIETNDDGTIKKDAEGNDKLATLYKLVLGTDSETGVPMLHYEEFSADGIYSSNKGEYTISGVVPNRYIIKYVYKDEGEDISLYTADGSAIAVKDGRTAQDIKVRDYKSTILTSEKIKAALSAKGLGDLSNISDERFTRMGDLNWILAEEKDGAGNLVRYSDAVDYISGRAGLADLYYGTFEGEETMIAGTAVFDIGVEFKEVTDNKSYTNTYGDTVNDEFAFLDEDGDGKTDKIVRRPSFYTTLPNQDFGLVERARQQVVIDKTISNLKVVLANGQQLINGNPFGNPGLNYVKAMPPVETNPIWGLEKTVLAEIDNELLQGATLEIEYTITVVNKSEKDFEYRYDELTDDGKKTMAEYYFYGHNDEHAKVLSTYIAKVVDYMDNSLVYNSSNDDTWEKVTADQLRAYEEKDESGNVIETKQLISKASDGRDAATWGAVYEDVKQGYTIAISKELKDKDIPINGTETTKIYGSRNLTTNENGIKAQNHVEIVETMGIRALYNSHPGNYNPKTITVNECDDNYIDFVITPPTGLLDNTVFIVTGIAIILVVLAGGVYLIKKKVLE